MVSVLLMSAARQSIYSIGVDLSPYVDLINRCRSREAPGVRATIGSRGIIQQMVAAGEVSCPARIITACSGR